MKRVVSATVICVAVLGGPVWGQWQGGPTGPIYYNGGNVGIGTASAIFPLTLSTGADRVLNFRGDPASFGLPSTLGGPIIQSVNTAQNAYVPMTFSASSFSLLGNVGIGTTNPGITLDVINAGQEQIYARSSTAGNRYLYMGVHTSGYARLGAWNPDVSKPFNLVLMDSGGNVGIGTTNPQHLLHVAGTIGAEEVIVSSTGADYVFAPDYRLRPLSEVAAYVREHQHLPEIPSAKDIEEKGVSLGEMQAKLLAKIEELTLHMIQAEERNNRLEQQNHEMQLQNRQLSEQIVDLKQRITGLGRR